MLQIQIFNKKKGVGLTEKDVQNEIVHRAMVNAEARKIAAGLNTKQPTKSVSDKKTPKKTTPVTNTSAIQFIDEILDKVSGYENSKITALAELALALETGDSKNLISFLKKKDKIVKVKTKY